MWGAPRLWLCAMLKLIIVMTPGHPPPSTSGWGWAGAGAGGVVGAGSQGCAGPEFYSNAWWL